MVLTVCVEVKKPVWLSVSNLAFVWCHQRSELIPWSFHGWCNGKILVNTHLCVCSIIHPLSPPGSLTGGQVPPVARQCHGCQPLLPEGSGAGVRQQPGSARSKWQQSQWSWVLWIFISLFSLPYWIKCHVLGGPGVIVILDGSGTASSLARLHL